jgi:hypothetical protein
MYCIQFIIFKTYPWTSAIYLEYFELYFTFWTCIIEISICICGIFFDKPVVYVNTCETILESCDDTNVEASLKDSDREFEHVILQLVNVKQR